MSSSTRNKCTFFSFFFFGKKQCFCIQWPCSLLVRLLALEQTSQICNFRKLRGHVDLTKFEDRKKHETDLDVWGLFGIENVILQKNNARQIFGVIPKEKK